MDSEFGQDSSIDPIISQEAGLNMSELGGNPNHNGSRDSISSSPQLKANINRIMDKAKNNESHFLQEFKNQLDNIPDINLFTIGIVTVEENKVEVTGKSLSEALLFAEPGENMLRTKLVLNVRNNFCVQHVLPRFELGISMY